MEYWHEWGRRMVGARLFHVKTTPTESLGDPFKSSKHKHDQIFFFYNFNQKYIDFDHQCHVGKGVAR